MLDGTVFVVEVFTIARDLAVLIAAAVLVVLAILGGFYLLELLERRRLPRLLRVIFRWVSKEASLLLYALPMALGLVALYWQAVVRRDEAPNPTVVTVSLLLASLGLIVWRSGPKLVRRISQIGPVRFSAAEEELAYLETLSRFTEPPELPEDNPIEWSEEPTDQQTREYTEFFESAARIVDSIRTTMVVQDQEFWNQKVIFELMFKAADFAYVLRRYTDALAYYKELSRLPDTTLGRLEIDRLRLFFRLGMSTAFVGDLAAARQDQARAESYYRDSIVILEKVARDYRTYPKTYYNLGWLHDRMGAFSDAIKANQIAINLNHNFHAARYNKACSMCKRNMPGDLDQVLRELEQIPNGHRLWTEILEDPDFGNMKQDPVRGPVFDALIQSHKA